MLYLIDVFRLLCRYQRPVPPPAFPLFIGARGFSTFSYQIATVAIGWQVYALTNSAFALGMVGLVQFIPSALLVFATGHAADRYDRKRVVQFCQMAEGLAAAFLAWEILLAG